jgi:23S rRNA pseudouridine1911/1915/1917 synthase
MRLDVALIELHPGLSRRKAREAIEKGQVSVEGRTVREAGEAVAAGAAIEWDVHKKALPRARLSLPTLYEDDDLVVVDKPAGLLSVATAPGLTEEDTVIARVRDYVGRLRPRHAYAGAVHRLDRDTSGALAVALHEEARRALRGLFGAHRAERRYLAIVEGVPPRDEATIDLPIRDQYEGGRRAVARPAEPSHPALTRYRVAERFPGAALLEVELATGRQHQIRVHLAHMGLPVLGDLVYRELSVRPPAVARRQMLHARLLAFTQPLSGASVRTESPLPADFETVLAALRGGRALTRGRRAGPRGRGRPR